MRKIAIFEGESCPVFSFIDVTGDEVSGPHSIEISDIEFNEIERIMDDYQRLQDYLESWYYPDKMKLGDGGIFRLK